MSRKEERLLGVIDSPEAHNQALFELGILDDDDDYQLYVEQEKLWSELECEDIELIWKYTKPPTDAQLHRLLYDQFFGFPESIYKQFDAQKIATLNARRHSMFNMLAEAKEEN